MVPSRRQEQPELDGLDLERMSSTRTASSQRAVRISNENEMAPEDITPAVTDSLLIEFVQQNDLRIRIGLREGHSFQGRVACSEEVFGNLDVERHADPGIELG
jgi:hypothetical protein